MSERHLHIISFDIPYPANYGGVIDVFYKIKAFKRAGVKIHLHCYEYGREPSDELTKYCEEVCYYKRYTGILANLSTTPYIVKSRISKELTNKLNIDNYPILFEGMHTFGIIDSINTKNRKIIYRAANVEHNYYKGLYKLETNLIKKAFFLLESKKLKLWEKNIAKANIILAISKNDEQHYKSIFPKMDIINTFLFYDNDIRLKPNFNSKESYILFHAKLSVHENIEAANYIIKKIAPSIKHKIIIAGLDPDKSIFKNAKGKSNVEVKANLSNDQMQKLLNNAQVNLLLTNQATGLKLKLINSLIQSKACIVNSAMISGSNLEDCVTIAETKEEIILEINKLMKEEFSEQDYLLRAKKIPKEYNNDYQIKQINNKLF